MFSSFAIDLPFFFEAWLIVLIAIFVSITTPAKYTRLLYC
jgi:hypothetical protein